MFDTETARREFFKTRVRANLRLSTEQAPTELGATVGQAQKFLQAA
jgi:hypothetical protein